MILDMQRFKTLNAAVGPNKPDFNFNSRDVNLMLDAYRHLVGWQGQTQTWLACQCIDAFIADRKEALSV